MNFIKNIMQVYLGITANKEPSWWGFGPHEVNLPQTLSFLMRQENMTFSPWSFLIPLKLVED